MEQTELQELVLAYKNGSASLESIFERIAVAIYANPRRFGFDGEDDASEALCRYRSRVMGLAERYVDNGVPFGAYLVSSLRFLGRTIRRERRRAREKEYVCEMSEGWKAEASTAETIGAGAPYAASDEGPKVELAPISGGRKPSAGEIAAFKSRLVFLYLKCAWEANDEKTRRVAEAASVPEDWLVAATAQSLRSLESERQRYERLAERRDRAWGRICLLEGRLRKEVDTRERTRIVDSVSREKSHLERVRNELQAFRPIVSNSIVARILGVPKGTVDSGLYYLKKRQLGDG